MTLDKQKSQSTQTCTKQYQIILSLQVCLSAHKQTADVVNQAWLMKLYYY